MHYTVEEYHWFRDKVETHIYAEMEGFKPRYMGYARRRDFGTMSSREQFFSHLATMCYDSALNSYKKSLGELIEKFEEPYGYFGERADLFEGSIGQGGVACQNLLNSAKQEVEAKIAECSNANTPTIGM